jgi:hypothetical protein
LLNLGIRLLQLLGNRALRILFRVRVSLTPA